MFRDFKVSRFQGFRDLGFYDFKVLSTSSFKVSRFQGITVLGLYGFRILGF